MSEPWQQNTRATVITLAVGSLVTWNGEVDRVLVFGPVTQAHVISFQSQHGLSADGIVGPVTALALGP